MPPTPIDVAGRGSGSPRGSRWCGSGCRRRTVGPVSLVPVSLVPAEPAAGDLVGHDPGDGGARPRRPRCPRAGEQGLHLGPVLDVVSATHDQDAPPLVEAVVE